MTNKAVTLRQLIALQIIEHRDLRGWTQLELAERMGTHQQAVSRWEAGKCVGLDTLTKLAGVFDCQVIIHGDAPPHLAVEFVPYTFTQ